MPKRVLVIDDEQAIAKAMSLRLRAAGLEVVLASSGEAGLAEVNNHKPDVIILDIRMPGIDGYEVCRRLKTTPETMDIPVVFVSANATETTRQMAFEVGGARFISKPYEPKDVLDTIHSVTLPGGGSGSQIG